MKREYILTCRCCKRTTSFIDIRSWINIFHYWFGMQRIYSRNGNKYKGTYVCHNCKKEAAKTTYSSDECPVDLEYKLSRRYSNKVSKITKHNSKAYKFGSAKRRRKPVVEYMYNDDNKTMMSYCSYS